MTSAPITASSPAAWLKQTAAPWRRLTILAGLLAVADVAPAVGFAGGLAMTVATFGSSPLAALPWLLLAVFSLMARGLIGQAAVVVGARLGRSIKTDVRDRLLADLFGRGGRADDGEGQPCHRLWRRCLSAKPGRRHCRVRAQGGGRALSHPRTATRRSQ